MLHLDAKPNDVNIGMDSAIVVPILSSNTIHRANNRLSLVYIKDINGSNEYIINCNHYDTDSYGTDWLFELKINTIFAYDSNVLRHYGLGCYDIEMAYWLLKNETLDLVDDRKYEIYNRWYPKATYINDFIPLTIHVGYCRRIVLLFESIHSQVHIDKTTIFFNKMLDNFRIIENSGIPINREKYIEHKGESIDSDYIYSKYNFFTSTGRPSNTFGGINFAALSKSSGIREIIESDLIGSQLLEFDYDSYHVRLAGKLIGYKFGNVNIHEYFGTRYFDVDTLTAEEYETSKAITFKNLYGYNNSKTFDIEFFNIVNEYLGQLWSEFSQNGYIKTVISGRKMLAGNFKNMTPNKLFNYLLQSYETELNLLRINELNDYLYNKKSKLILYTYDSFLFNYNVDDGDNFIDDVVDILNKDDMPVNISIGSNYNDMVTLKSDKIWELTTKQ